MAAVAGAAAVRTTTTVDRTSTPTSDDTDTDTDSDTDSDTEPRETRTKSEFDDLMRLVNGVFERRAAKARQKIIAAGMARVDEDGSAFELDFNFARRRAELHSSASHLASRSARALRLLSEKFEAKASEYARAQSTDLADAAAAAFAAVGSQGYGPIRRYPRKMRIAGR